MVSRSLLALAFLRLILAIEYSSKMVNQRISYYENPHVGMDVKFYGDEGHPYLTLLDEVTHYNDLHLMVYAKKFDKEPVLLSHSPVSLCQLLYDSGVARSKEYLSSPMAQFNLPQIFNFNGKVCPIEQSTIRLSPYVFPANFTFDASLGCGYRNVEARLLKCSDEPAEGGVRDCETLAKNVLYAYFENEQCKDEVSQGDGAAESGNWVYDRIADVMRIL